MILHKDRLIFNLRTRETRFIVLAACWGLFALLLLVFAATAQAQESRLPTYGNPVPDQQVNTQGLVVTQVVDHWTGPYAGVTLGLSGSGASVNQAAVNGGDLELDAGNPSAGLLIGYSYAPLGRSDRGQWLIGGELDVQNLSGSDSARGLLAGGAKLSSNWMASARLRGGYAWEDYYLYGTAGLALTDMQVETQGNKSDDLRAGLALGLGLETVMSDQWKLRLEGLAYGFGEDDQTINGKRHKVSMGAALLRLGVTYRF